MKQASAAKAWCVSPSGIDLPNSFKYFPFFFNLMFPIIHLSQKIINRGRNENLSHILRSAAGERATSAGLALASSIISVRIRLLAGQIPPSTHPRLLTGAAPPGETPTLPSYFNQQLLEPQLKRNVWGKGRFLQSAKGPDLAASGNLPSILQILLWNKSYGPQPDPGGGYNDHVAGSEELFLPFTVIL